MKAGGSKQRQTLMSRNKFTRREWLRTSAVAGTAVLCSSNFPPLARAAEASPATTINLGSRRELFIDDFVIGKLAGKAELRLHHPEPREIALVHDAPWEGSGTTYHSVFQDGGLYRMYYKAEDFDVQPPGRLKTDTHPRFCCYAESDDGIRWRKPELGLHEFNGSRKNNIVMVPEKTGSAVTDPGHVAVFKDENPAAPAAARYKAVVRSEKPRGLLAFKSPDGLHWTPMTEGPVITDGAFDSQNLVFWDSVRGEYRAYWRIFADGVRAIRTATSKDFLNWGPRADVIYVDSPPEHLYTNQIKSYHRAPHIFIGLPARYLERGWSDSMRALPELEHRELRARAHLRYGAAISEGLLMASRDGRKFKRWNEAFLRPGIERPGTWNYGHQFIAWHLVETKSALEGAPNELSLYAGESCWTDHSSKLRRYTLRLDGFVSVSAPMSGGDLVTRPLTFKGTKLTLNFATSAAGDVRVEIQDAAGKPLPGFSLADCPPIFGDTIQRTVTWKNGGDVGALAGRPVRVRFVLRDADLFAIQFQ